MQLYVYQEEIDNLSYIPSLYYRIKAMDTNGTYSHSNIIKLNAENIETNMSIFPNPTTEKVTIDITLNEQSTVIINVVNETGQQIFNDILEPTSYQTQTEVYTKNWAEGIYFIQIKSISGTKTERLVVHH